MNRPLLSISEAGRLTGKARETVRIAARSLKGEPGPKNSTLYDSTQLLALLYLGEGGPTYSEAMRRLTLKREEQIALEIRLKQDVHIPIEDYKAAMLQSAAQFRAVLITNEGKMLTADKIDDALGELTEFAIAQLPEEERRAARRDICLDAIARVDSHIEYLRTRIQQDQAGAEVKAKLARLRDAYTACEANRTSKTLAALQQARDELKAAA